MKTGGSLQWQEKDSIPMMKQYKLIIRMYGMPQSISDFPEWTVTT
jgi:hypothetical protein